MEHEQLKALARDAERYRWLRERLMEQGGDWVRIGLGDETYPPESLDDWIDRNMAASP